MTASTNTETNPQDRAGTVLWLAANAAAFAVIVVAVPGCLPRWLALVLALG